MYLISDTDKKLHSENAKENGLLSVFLTLGIRMSLPALRDILSLNSKLHIQKIQIEIHI
jgi:hypothetical protein